MREGLSTKVSMLHAQTLQQMNFHIKTQYGCSTASDGHLRPNPFLGSGQGAGDSMSRWGFVSDALLQQASHLTKYPSTHQPDPYE
jgi:hypothetical protein